VLNIDTTRGEIITLLPAGVQRATRRVS
jgi:hypothetical protein